MSKNPKSPKKSSFQEEAEKLFIETNAAFKRLQEDEAAWEEEMAERKEWLDFDDSDVDQDDDDVDW